MSFKKLCFKISPLSLESTLAVKTYQTMNAKVFDIIE